MTFGKSIRLCLTGIAALLTVKQHEAPPAVEWVDSEDWVPSTQDEDKRERRNRKRDAARAEWMKKLENSPPFTEDDHKVELAAARKYLRTLEKWKDGQFGQRKIGEGSYETGYDRDPPASSAQWDQWYKDMGYGEAFVIFHENALDEIRRERRNAARRKNPKVAASPKDGEV